MQVRWNEIRIMAAHDAGDWKRGARVAACLLAMAAASVPCDFGQSPQLSAPTNSAQPKQSIINPAANRPPDKNDQMAMRERNAIKANYEAANEERKRQLTDDSAALLKLSNELKEELAKSTKDTLSLDVVRKADEIARLAHNVQVKMKLTVNAAY
jgi:hypothetical protein